MNLVADESVDSPIVERLRQDGHAVFYIAELDPGIDDGAVLDEANRSGALLITSDKDFGELVFSSGSDHYGCRARTSRGVVCRRESGHSIVRVS